MKHQRGKNLDDGAVANIVGLIDGWSGKLTWDLLLAAVERHKHGRYTRQALNNHSRIAEAFRVRKKALAASGTNSGERKTNSSPEVQAALERIARLEAANERLNTENNRLLDQFVRWAYNA